MFRRKAVVSVIALVIATTLLAGCGPAPTPEVVTEVKEVEVEVTRIVEGESEVVVVTATPEPEEPREGPVMISWWSHWAEEDNKKNTILEVIADYEAEHPDVDIVVTWWQKAEMWPAMRNAFTAGEGFPDIFYYDTGVLEFIDAGWLEDLSDDVNWDNVLPVGKDFWTRDGGVWAIPLEGSSDHIYYNVRLFDELGIEVPDDFQFTADEFLEVCQTCKDAGYAPFARESVTGTTPASTSTSISCSTSSAPKSLSSCGTGRPNGIGRRCGRRWTTVKRSRAYPLCLMSTRR